MKPESVTGNCLKLFDSVFSVLLDKGYKTLHKSYSIKSVNICQLGHCYSILLINEQKRGEYIGYSRNYFLLSGYNETMDHRG